VILPAVLVGFILTFVIAHLAFSFPSPPAGESLISVRSPGTSWLFCCFVCVCVCVCVCVGIWQ